MNGRMDGMSGRIDEMKDYVDERTRDMETHLLAEFRRWALRLEGQLKPLPAQPAWKTV